MATLASLSEEAPSVSSLDLGVPAVGLAKDLFPLVEKTGLWASRLLPCSDWALDGLGDAHADLARVLAEFRDDPLVYHGRIPSRTGAEILRASGEVRRAAAKVRLPVLILQGTADAVVSSEEVQRFYDELSSGDKTLRLYPGLYHDLPREPERQTILTELAAWIERRCGG